MLYSLFETNRAMLYPVQMLARSTKGLSNHPMAPLPMQMLGRALEAGAEVVDGVLQRRGKPDWRLRSTQIDGKWVGVRTEAELVAPFCDLVRFRRDTNREDPKVLLIAPLSGHFSTLLRGTVEALLPEHDVYVTDWIDAARVPLLEGRLSVDDYTDYLLRFIRHLGPDVHVIAVCQPAPLAIVANSILAQLGDDAQPRSMTLMGGPVDTRAAPTVPTQLADRRAMSWFETRCITLVPGYYPGAYRRVYPGFLQLGAFIAMNADRHINAHLRMFRHLIEGDGDSADSHRAFYDEYMSVMDVPAEYYLDTIRRVFKEHWLPHGRWTWHGDKVEPRAITKTALLTVEGELDDISAPGQTLAAHKLCSGLPDAKRRHHLQSRVGHYGIFNGRRWREEIMPVIAAFIRDSEK